MKTMRHGCGMKITTRHFLVHKMSHIYEYIRIKSAEWTMTTTTNEDCDFERTNGHRNPQDHGNTLKLLSSFRRILSMGEGWWPMMHTAFEIDVWKEVSHTKYTVHFVHTHNIIINNADIIIMDAISVYSYIWKDDRFNRSACTQQSQSIYHCCC